MVFLLSAFKNRLFISNSIRSTTFTVFLASSYPIPCSERSNYSNRSFSFCTNTSVGTLTNNFPHTTGFSSKKAFIYDSKASRM